MLQERHQYLKAVLIDEIIMTDNGTVDCLNQSFRAINRRNDFDFGAAFALTVGDFFQLPLGNQQYIQKYDTDTCLLHFCDA